MTTVVSIGRNIGSAGGRLTGDAWKEYRADVADAVEDAAGPLVFHGDGYGHDPVSGTTEQSFTVIGAGTPDLTGLTLTLARIARRYGQESVAMTVGATTFPGETVTGGEAS